MNQTVQNILVALSLVGVFVWYAFTNSPASVFFFGMAILVLFLWYFATDLPRRKRIAGALLTVLITALCLQALWPRKMNKSSERHKYENLSAETVGKLKEAVAGVLTAAGFSEDTADTRKDFPGKPDGNYTEKKAYRKSGDGGTSKAYLISGTMKEVPGEANQFVNVFKFWEADEPTKARQKPKPAPAELNKIWKGVAAAAAPFDRTKPDYTIPMGIDLAGGSDFQVKIRPKDGGQVARGEIDRVNEILSDRLNQMGGKDLQINKLSDDTIRLQMPGVDEEQRDSIHKLITKPSVLNFYIVDERKQGDSPAVARNEKVIPGMKAYPAQKKSDGVGGYYLLSKQPDLEGSYVKLARAQFSTRWTVSLDFNSEGSKRFGELTSRNVGKQLAIVLDDVVISAPVIRGAIYGTTEISGDFTEQDVTSLSASLNNPLQNPLVIESESSVDPALGRDAIKQGIVACLSGMALTLLFMLFYYRFGGFVAVLGLIVNLLILLGSMALFGFTLTLPGIAGIVLTIGMAVDANVLIYERFREERAAGKSVEGALNAAYEKAFSAIFDSNITTLITAALLYFVASGPIRGFAVTLTVGIVGTLFQALIVSRIILAWVVDKGWIKDLKFASLIPVKYYDFLSKRRFAYIFTTVISLALPLGLIIFKEKAFGIDFRGGHMFTMKAEGVTKEAVQTALAKLGEAEAPVVQVLKPVGAEAEYISIRMTAKSNPEEANRQVSDVKTLLKQDLKLAESVDITNQTIGGSVGKHLLYESTLALGLGILGIFFYLGLRFEFSFAVGAIIALFHDVLIAIGLCIITGREMNLVLVGAFLTIAGYSVNDTIVIFDRIREGVRTKTGDIDYIMNASISETLPRTLLTGGTTLLSMITLYLFGGAAMRDFAFAMFFGTVIGTYSSIFVASPIALWWAKRSGKGLEKEILDADEARRASLDGAGDAEPAKA